MNLRDRLNQLSVPADLFPELTSAEKATNHALVQIASQIFHAREQQGKTQQQLAQDMGVAQSLVCKWESGDCNFTLSHVIEILSHLGINLELSFSNASDSATKWSTLPNRTYVTQYDSATYNPLTHLGAA